MKNSFLLSYKVKIAYRVNAIIYSLRQFKFLKNVIPSNLYGNDGLNILYLLISIIHELISVFLGKIIYIFIFFYLALNFLNSLNTSSIFNVFLFLSLIGSILNNFLLDATNDKYYSVIFLKMDAKKYAISNFIFYLTKLFIGLSLTISTFLILLHINACYTIIIALYILSTKVNSIVYILKKYKKNLNFEKNKRYICSKWLMISIYLSLAYIIPYFKIQVSLIVYIIIFLISIIKSIASLKYIINYDYFYEMYHFILTDVNMDSIKEIQTKENKDISLKTIENKKNFTSSKKGYAYFNDIFIKRHSSILYSYIKKITYFIIGITFFTIIVLEINMETKEFINKNLLQTLPFILLIMFFLNTGQRVSKVMYMNCDCAMLSYQFYKEKKAILSLFKERLKSIIKMNLISSFVLSICFILVLYLSGGTKIKYAYLFLFLSINMISIFFSIHNLVIYYLLQPYNYNCDVKGVSYRIISILTYMICYYVTQINLEFYTFTIITCIFSIVYTVASLVLVYNIAHKTFKIRV